MNNKLYVALKIQLWLPSSSAIFKQWNGDRLKICRLAISLDAVKGLLFYLESNIAEFLVIAIPSKFHPSILLICALLTYFWHLINFYTTSLLNSWLSSLVSSDFWSSELSIVVLYLYLLILIWLFVSVHAWQCKETLVCWSVIFEAPGYDNISFFSEAWIFPISN